MLRTAVFALVLVVGVALTLFTLLTHGASFSLFGIVMTMRNPARPFAVAGVAAALLVSSSPGADRGLQKLAELAASARLHRATAIGVAAAITVTAIVDGSFVASAADSYGYVAQARLFASGALSAPQEWAQLFCWPDTAAVWSPFGFKPSADGARLVPAYPPGLPLLMAAFRILGGERAVYLVVPVASGLLVFGTFLLGRVADRSSTGLVAALLLACSPTFLFHACIPMSDVPASAAWTMAMVAALAGGSARTVMSGMCAGLAILIRPNLAPLLVAPAIAILMATEQTWHARRRSLALFAIGATPALAALALLNRAWYGRVFATGYQLDDAFRLDYLWTNAFSYPRWLVETQTLFILLVPIGLFLLRSRPRLVLGAVMTIVALSYAFYAPLDHWTYLRFLLPAFPAALILASACATRVLAIRFPRAPVVQVCVMTLVGVVALSTLQNARIRGAFANHVSLERFADVPRFARASLPARAVYLTRLYSGSLREHGDRPTVRWDLLDPAWLDRAVADLHARGHAVFIVIEGQDERQQFIDRFAAHSRLAALDWPAAAEYKGVETVWLYDVADRERSSHEVTTRAIPD